MTLAELKELERLLSLALDDENVSGLPVYASGRGKRYGTDIARALDGVRKSIDKLSENA